MEELEKKIEEASKKYALRDGYHDELYKDEEAFVAGAKSEEAKAFHTQGMYTAVEVREIALKFWFWWYNQTSGTNTYQAFDEWFKNQSHEQKN